MSQPIWKCVANLGDVDALTFGGLYVFVDETGVYAPEMERVELIIFGDDTPEEILSEDYTGDEPAYECHRVSLERCTDSQDPTTGERFVSANRYHPYTNEWFSDDLAEVGSYVDSKTLREDLCSEDPITRATAYRAIYDYHGWDNGDPYPSHHTYRDIAKHIESWDTELKQQEAR